MDPAWITTFTNASFFLQGHADQPPNSSLPTGRKERILGLEVWETFRLQAFDQRRQVENELKMVDSQVAEINSELALENERKSKLADVEQRLEQASALRQAKESNLTALQRLAQSLDEQRKLLDLMKSRVGEIRSRVASCMKGGAASERA
jgi:DNA repair exonuclease SbcCD ATPase subunit